MCGIAGILQHGQAPETLARQAQGMAAVLAHRGPDDAGVWSAPGVALGHRRLAILDLSSAGAQPMLSASGRHVLSYNGELFNFPDLRRTLTEAGCAFKGQSDTEVLLAACEVWGVEAAVGRLLGMFAFALWDAREQRLWLCRDRLGVKPLYYAELRTDGRPGLAFASELKALRTLPGFDPAVDREAVTLYLRHASIPSPRTIYAAARTLPPGTLACVTPESCQLRMTKYWDVLEVWRRGQAAPFAGGPEEAAEALHPLLLDATRRRMIADVPVGALLSGGIDSTVTAMLMREAGGGQAPLQAFTVRFAEAAYDESDHARAAARALGLTHHVLPVSARDLLALVPSLPELWDEPFGDSSQVPTHLIFRHLAGRAVVALSGDGADECFAGYARYAWALQFSRLERLPMPLRRLGAWALARVPGALLRRAGPRGPKLQWRAQLLRSQDFPSFYRALLSSHLDPAALVLGGREPERVWTSTDLAALLPNRLSWMQALDSATYLPDDILVKVDRASMGASIEARSPFLDHRVVEFAATLPPRATVREGKGKQPLRILLARGLPAETAAALLQRPKAGFTVPLEQWLGHELRDWAESLLSPEALRRTGLLREAPVRALWRAHLQGDTSRHSLLWNLLMLQAWDRRWNAGGWA